MNNSPTGESSAAPASNEPTGQAPVDNTAESQNQETISHEQSQEAVSHDETQPKQNSGSSQNDDDGLAKFAKSQGFDPENLSDDVKRALKIAHDNQKAYRNTANEKKVTDVSAELNTSTENESEDEAFRRDFRQFKYEQIANKFWSEASADGKPVRDNSLEPTMVEILNEKRKQFGDAYARNLSQDLPALYDLAARRSGAVGGSQVDTEAIRREERESIRQKQNASAGQPHAVTQNNSASPKVDREWISKHYDPKNPEHVKMVDEAAARGEL